ncbi:WD40 repeat domain-containing protein [Tateyamaria omphalii]|uniref:WD40 repeat domain-containing protein n=1 Tax=Tateyamaria omphalii TaxID=299262 RepID=UPI0034A0C37B
MRRLLSSLFLCLALPVWAQDFTTYKGHGGPVMGLVVTEDGTLASASFDNSVGVWHGAMPEWLEGHDAAVTAIAEGLDGTLVTGGDDFAVWHWGETPRKIGQHKGKVTSLAPSPDGTVIAAGSWDGDIVLWPVGAGEAVTLPYPGAGVNAVAYSADGAFLYAATSKGDVLRYDMTTGDVPRRWCVTVLA